MPDVFISYSRRDSDFARRLTNELERLNRDAWIDYQDIPRGENWLKEIYANIEAADAFLLIVSQHSLTSEICTDEIAHARQHNKRIVPLIRQRIEGDTEKIVKGTWVDTLWHQTARDNWEAVRHINWLFFDDDARFDSEMAELLKALDEDLPHRKAHTRYLVRALEWERGARNPSFLLTGDEIAAAERWLAEGAGKQPQPDALHREYVTASREAETQRARLLRNLRRAAVTLAIVGLLAVIATVVSVTQVVSGEQRLNAIATQVQNGENRIQSLDYVEPARAALTNDESMPALALLLAANRMDNPPAAAQRTLADAAYAPGPRRRFSGHTTWARSLAYSPNGTMALSGGCGHEDQPGFCTVGELILWDLATGEILRIFSGHTNSIISVAYSPDGMTAVSRSLDKTVVLWDLATGQATRTLSGYTGDISREAYSPDSKTILSGSTDGSLILWDVATGEALRAFTGHTDVVTGVIFSLDGVTALSGSRDNTLILWDIETGEQRRTFSSLGTLIRFNPDGTTALSTGSDDALILWDTATGEVLQTFTGHSDRVTNAAFSPDGTTALSSSFDQTVILWDTATGQSLQTFTGHRDVIWDVAYSSDGTAALSGSSDGTLMLWDLTAAERVRTYTGHTRVVWSAAYSPNGMTALSASGDHSLILWDIVTGETLRTFPGHPTGDVRSVAFTPDGVTALSASGDHSLILWDVAIGAALRTFSGHSDWVNSVFLTPDGTRALSGSCAVRVRDNTFNCTQGELILWDIATGEALRTFIGHTDLVNSVAVSPDGTAALSASGDQTLILWDIATGEQLRTFSGHRGEVLGVAYSPDGRTALSASGDQTLILWDIATGEQLRTFSGHTGEVRSVAFSADGTTALSGSADNTLILWDIATGEALRTFTGHASAVYSVAYSPDGRTALSGSEDNSLMLWRLDTLRELVAWTCANRLIDVTDEQRRRYNVPVSEPNCPQWAADFPPIPAPEMTPEGQGSG